MSESLPLLLGAGGERELFGDHTEYFIHTGAQYEFHFGRWGVAPAGWIDWVENGKQLVFVGATVGIGF